MISVDPDTWHEDCRWCNMCGLPVMDGIFIRGYCQLPDMHDGDCSFDVSGETR